MKSDDGSDVTTGNYCDVCGNADDELRTPVEVCRDCLDAERNAREIAIDALAEEQMMHAETSDRMRRLSALVIEIDRLNDSEFATYDAVDSAWIAAIALAREVTEQSAEHRDDHPKDGAR